MEQSCLIFLIPFYLFPALFHAILGLNVSIIFSGDVKIISNETAVNAIVSFNLVA